MGSFADGRLGYREWARRNGRLADIHSLEDRYDHDIDELMALSWPQLERVPTKSAPACDASRGACTTCSGCVGSLQAVLGNGAGGGLRLPQAKVPSEVALRVILFWPQSHCRGSGSLRCGVGVGSGEKRSRC